jgi:hypothetical protein
MVTRPEDVLIHLVECAKEDWSFGNGIASHAIVRLECPGPSRILRQLLANFGNVFMGGRPVRVACIAVEHQRARFQFRFELFLIECNCLVVILRTYDFEVYAVAHQPPADLAIRQCARSISLANSLW